jgi:DNA end-binding protein Ku
MPRAIWSGTISFGLLNVPVKLYSAVSSQKISFRELRAADGSRVRHKRVAENDGEEVSYDDMVKGYEISPDQYVVLTKEELEELAPKKTRAIEIHDFVDVGDIDPIYFNQPYYLGPDKGSEKAYALLAKAMTESGKAAIARFVLRNKENLAAIRSDGKVLTMATMRFADEIVPPERLDDVLGADGEAPAKREVEMAEKLIDSLAADWNPEAYRDEYREELLELIERKARGESVVSATTEEPKPTKAPDLMAALEESLAAVRGEELGKGGSDDGDEAKPKKKSTAKSKSGSSSSSKSANGAGGSKSRSSKAKAAAK